MVLVGADGVRGGWVAAALQGPSDLAAVQGPTDLAPALHLFDSFAALLEAWPGEAVRVAVDVPIGLTAHGGARDVDRAMRRRLRGQASSVFNPPARFLLPVAGVVGAGAQWAEVQHRLERHRAARPGEPVLGISRQTLGILPKVAEVDLLLRGSPELCDRVGECHPELSFMAMNGGAPLEGPKTSARGLLQRLALVRAAFPAVEEVVAGYPAAARVPLADVVDAFAALWTARRWHAGDAEVLGAGARDDAGLPVRVLV